MSYFDQSGNIREELLDQEAIRIAESFVIRNQKYPTKLNKAKSLSSAQLRRFFGEFRQLEKKVTAKSFDEVKPLIKMVKSKVSYAANRQQAFPSTFKDFLIRNVNQINSEKEFEAFMLHFEAVVGFFYGIEGVRND